MNGVGMALAFLTFLLVLFALALGFEFDLYWSEAAVEEVENAEQLLRVGLAIGLPLSGLVFSSSQATALLRSAVPLRPWVLAGPIGFILPSLLIWPFTAIWGDIPGPVEPFTIVGGALLGTAVLQWLSLRRTGLQPIRWLILWILGLPVGMVAFAILYVLIDAFIDVGWAAEVILIGFAIGSCAAAVSGRALARMLQADEPSMPG